MAPFQFSGASIIDDLKQKIQQKEQEIRQLEQKAEEYKKEIKERQNQAATIKNNINYLNSQINTLWAEILLTQSHIEQTELQIESLKAGIDQKEEEILRQKANLAGIIRIINENDQEETLQILLKNENFSEFLNQIEYIEILQNEIQKELDVIKTLKIKLEQDKEEQEIKKTDLGDFKNQLDGKKQAFDDQKGEKEYLLKVTKNQEASYQNLLKEVQKKRQEIEKEIYELEDKLRLTIDPNSIPPYRSGVLIWPISGRITQGYGPTSATGFINNGYNFHNGLDIAASSGSGTPIRAAADGAIAGVGDNGKYAYGKWIAIKHNNGLTTLYGHLSSAKLAVGTNVKTGDIIGYEGSTGFSTGPHLHFTVYATNTFRIEDRWYGPLPLGGSIDPMKYL